MEKQFWRNTVLKKHCFENYNLNYNIAEAKEMVFEALHQMFSKEQQQLRKKLYWRTSLGLFNNGLFCSLIPLLFSVSQTYSQTKRKTIFKTNPVLKENYLSSIAFSSSNSSA